MTKIAALALVACIAAASRSSADDVVFSRQALLRVDWQFPETLPPRFRNHCVQKNFTGRPYCSDHCGWDYQFYYCSEGSYGCCHLGHGYCDFNGFLRCHP